MDGTPLDKAYTAAKNGDAAVISGDFKTAASRFMDAAEYFEQVRMQAPENPSSRTLKALAEQYKRRSEYFSSGKAAIDTRRHGISPSSSTSLANTNTNTNTGTTPGTGAVNTSRSHTRTSWNDSPSNTNIGSNQLASSAVGPTNQSVTPLGEAINALVMRSQAVFVRTFEQAVAERAFPSGGAAGGTGPSLESVNAPSESFYLVKPKSNEDETKSSPPGSGGANNRITMTRFDRTQAIERATKAQKAALKSGLRRIMNDVASREQQINDEHTEEVDRLRAENDKLKIQVSKLKSRWEELKESARKRLTTDQ